jgi:hypothetical protein
MALLEMYPSEIPTRRTHQRASYSLVIHNPVRTPLNFACQRSMKTGGATRKKYLEIFLKKMTVGKKFLLAKKIKNS